MQKIPEALNLISTTFWNEEELLTKSMMGPLLKIFIKNRS